MSNPDDLTRAMAENGAYDPEKAEEMRTKMVGTFEAAVRKVERYLWIYMCLCTWLFVFTFYHFMLSSTTKALLFYGLLMLFFFETTILMKLWYWIMNNKIGVLKEIKQLQLDKFPADDADASAERTKRLQGPLKGLSRRERAAWWVVLIVGGALVGAVKGVDTHGMDDPWDLGRGGSLTSDGCVTLAPDGSGLEVTHMSFVHQGTLARRWFNFYAPKSRELRFTDTHGRELRFATTTTPEPGRVGYRISLPRPVMPGRRFSYNRTQQCPKSATEEGDIWTHSNDVSYGYDTNEFSQTVVLPEGAEIVSVTPWPVATFTLQGKPTIRFKATRGSNERFKYTIQYRLPAEPSGHGVGK